MSSEQTTSLSLVSVHGRLFLTSRHSMSTIFPFRQKPIWLSCFTVLDSLSPQAVFPYSLIQSDQAEQDDGEVVGPGGRGFGVVRIEIFRFTMMAGVVHEYWHRELSQMYSLSRHWHTSQLSSDSSMLPGAMIFPYGVRQLQSLAGTQVHSSLQIRPGRQPRLRKKFAGGRCLGFRCTPERNLRKSNNSLVV